MSVIRAEARSNSAELDKAMCRGAGCPVGHRVTPQDTYPAALHIGVVGIC